jgi:1-acyl-sn-glycerol-3-phosphate acyltransferase
MTAPTCNNLAGLGAPATPRAAPRPGPAHVTPAADFPSASRDLPAISPLLWRVFSNYSRWYVARHFHAVRLSADSPPPQAGGLPLVIYVNHASWWDPLICLLLQDQFFAPRPAFAPIDQDALARYRFFRKLGFFGVEPDSIRGAGQFLRTATAILQRPQSILWLTPQGRFADARERPAGFKSGLGHLPARAPRAAYVPLAVEYVFWHERKPEVLCRFGEMEIIERGPRRDWTTHFEQRMAGAQNALADQALRRNAGDFQSLIKSNPGVGPAYDAWRWLRAKLAGHSFRRGHGNL